MKIFVRKKKRLLVHSLTVCASILLIGFVVFSANSSAAEKNTKGSEIMEKCAQCHDDVVAAFKSNPHRALNAYCTDCHGSAEKHMEEGGLNTITTFKGSAVESNKQCLKCHKTSTARYMVGPHGKSSMACTQCHSIHSVKSAKSVRSHEKKLLKTDSVALCKSCHGDVYAQFQLNERHRLKEGILECTSCHNVHEPASRSRLGGFKNEACATCHRDKNGPFVHEHQASRIEGCTVCHEAHGSPNRHMLKHQNLSQLCFSCHTAAPSWHRGFTTTPTNCTSCHSAIHGSNLDKLLLK